MQGFAPIYKQPLCHPRIPCIGTLCPRYRLRKHQEGWLSERELLAARGFTVDRRGAPGNVRYKEYW